MRQTRDGSRAMGSTSKQSAIQDGTPAGATVPGAAPASQPELAGTSLTQPTIPDDWSEGSAGAPPPPNQGVYQDVLVQCNTLVERYRKGEASKASVYANIQSKLIQALGNDRERSDAAFGSFIATIESHDSELEMAARRAPRAGPSQRSPSLAVSDADERESDDEPVSKKPKLDESEYAWVAGRKGRPVTLSENPQTP